MNKLFNNETEKLKKKYNIDWIISLNGINQNCLKCSIMSIILYAPDIYNIYIVINKKDISSCIYEMIKNIDETRIHIISELFPRNTNPNNNGKKLFYANIIDLSEYFFISDSYIILSQKLNVYEMINSDEIPTSINSNKLTFFKKNDFKDNMKYVPLQKYIPVENTQRDLWKEMHEILYKKKRINKEKNINFSLIPINKDKNSSIESIQTMIENSINNSNDDVNTIFYLEKQNDEEDNISKNIKKIFPIIGSYMEDYETSMNKINPIKTDDYKISICLCIRDGETYIQYINNVFKIIEQVYPNITFEYFIYENNSTDNSKEYIKQFYKENQDRKGKYWLEDIPNTSEMMDGIQIERGTHMANLRNKLKRYHGVLTSDYTLLLDCDVIFKKDLFYELIKSIDKDIAMVTPFCISYHHYKNIAFKKFNIKRLYEAPHYYDTLALITQDNISYKETGNTCIFEKCCSCRNHRKNIKIELDDKFSICSQKIIPVKAAFGSMAFIKTDVYNKIKWGESICEHHSFCEEVNKYGKVVINQDIHIVTTSPELRQYSMIERLLNQPR